MSAVELGSELAAVAGLIATLAVGDEGILRVVTVQVGVQTGLIGRPLIDGDLPLPHGQLDLRGLARLQGDGDRVAPFRGGRLDRSPGHRCDLFRLRRFSRRVLRDGGGRRDDCLPRCRCFGLRCRASFTVSSGFLGQLHLDFAHLGQVEDATDPGRVDAVFGGQDNGYQNDDGGQ